MLALDVTGMDCMGCVKSVEKAVRRVDPRAEVTIDLPTGRVTINATSEERATFEAAIKRAGYGIAEAA